MKKLLTITMVIIIIFSLAACSRKQVSNNEQNPVGSSSGSNMATRKIEKGTAIVLKVGDTVIPATLNDSTSSKELLSRLPFTVHLNRFSHDYCGVMENPLKYDEKDVHYGWMNGDIDFARDGNYFTILFEDEEKSKIYGHQVNLGKVNCDLSVIKKLGKSIDVRIELAH
ncbi:MAG: hypothetical protein LIR50_07740 [Bacillota bacterium]|nr:hypothetical protein [Bacillota bacterium]